MDQVPVRVPHAGCALNGVVSSHDGVIVCDGCHQRITDPSELAPRGTGFTPDRQLTRLDRYRLDA